jgi:hypothetical protein
MNVPFLKVKKDIVNRLARPYCYVKFLFTTRSLQKPCTHHDPSSSSLNVCLFFVGAAAEGSH